MLKQALVSTIIFITGSEGKLNINGKSIFQSNVVQILMKFGLVVNFRYCVQVLIFLNVSKLQKKMQYLKKNPFKNNSITFQLL